MSETNEFLQQNILAIAFILDLIFGDPLWLPHPVRQIGFIINWLEKYLRKIFPTQLKIAGIILNLSVIAITVIITWGLIKIVFLVSPIASVIVEIFFIYTTISTTSLIKAGEKVMRYLKNNRIYEARIALSEIVSRDTSRLDRSQILKGVIETSAENTSDGIIAPLFFAALGGAPLAMAYKAINTLDSMVGYKNQRYKDFGWFSAKMDDVANFIPARITGLLITIAGALMFKRPLVTAKAIWRDSQKGPSPNAGIPICGIAGTLDVQLGGPAKQKDGSIVNIPFIGGARKELKFSDFDSVTTLILVLPVLFLIGFYLLKG